MEVTAGFKRTDVGVIPEDWGTPTLDSLTVLMTNGFVGTATTHYVSNENGVLYIQGYNVKENGFDFHGIKFVTREFHRVHMKSCLRAGDLLTIQTGEVGLTTIVPESLAGSNCHALIISRCDPKKAFPAFISYYLNSKPGRSRLRLIETGTTMKHLNVGDVLKFVVPLPPNKAEQEAIAIALSDGDALIGALEQLLVKKRQLRQGAMQDLLTGKKRLLDFSGKWVEKPLSILFDFSGGFTASRDQLSSNGYCYLHYGDIHASKKTFIDVRAEYQGIPKLDLPLKKVSSASLLSDGDIVFVDASEDDEGTSKHVVIVNPDNIPFISGLHTIVAKSKSNDFEHQYLRYCFQTSAVKAQFRFFAVGTKVSGISKTNISKITLPVPSLAEQSAISTILCDIDAEIAELSEKLAKVRQLKLGMMQELLTGRVRLV